MQLASAPGKIVLAFAADDATKNVIPVASQIPVTPGAASYTDGFPPLTAVDPTQGGVGPSKADMNGILSAISALSLWFNSGAGFLFDAAFAATVGGYPIGARVLKADNTGYWISTIDNNSNNPDTGGAGWMLEGGKPSASVYASAGQTLAVGNSKVGFNTVEWNESLWDAPNQRFLASITGKYRISGSVYLTAPAAQNLTTEIYVNGALNRLCFQMPQISDMDISLPFHAIVSLNAGDFAEIFVNVSQTAIVVASGSTSVFAQCEYIGA